jgi:cell division protein FtsL
VSGPAGGVASLAVGGGYGTVALPAPTRTRRRVGPAAPARRTIRLPRPRLPRVELPSPSTLAQGTAAFVVSLPESSLLDRVIRGRTWIPLLGILLVGIVGMQVENLKLNAGLGTAVEQTTTLQSRNDALRSYDAELSDPQRIEGIAAQHGMVMAPPASIKFVSPGSSTSVNAAIASIHAPGSAYFVSPVGTSSAAAAAASPGSTTTTTPAAAG